MFGIGMPEMIVILVIALIVIGPSKLPEIARSIGKGYGEFSRSMRSVREDFEDITSDFEEERQILKNPIDEIAKKAKNSLFEDEPSSSKTTTSDKGATPAAPPGDDRENA